MGLVRFLRELFMFNLFLTLIDTMVVTALLSSGIPVESWAYFAPAVNGMSLYQNALAIQQAASSGLAKLNVWAYFFLLVTPSFAFAFINFVIGTFVGLPLLVYNVLAAAGAPVGVQVAFVTAAAVMQGFADLWVMDTLISWVIGRTPYLTMLFGE